MLKFCDSADHYDTTHILSKWTAASGVSVSSSAGRNGNGLLLAAGGNIDKTLGLQSKFVVGFAYRVNLSGGTINGNPYSLAAVSTGRGLNTICEMAILPDMTPAVYAGNQLIINPTGFTFSSGAWNYIEISIELGAGSGGTINVAVVLHINGQNLGSGNHDSNVLVSSQLCNDTKANYHTFSAMPSGVGSCYLDDVYICDKSGGVNDTFLGDIKIGCIFPRQDVTTGWTPSTGTTHFSLVNEHVPDDDSTYVFTNSASAIDSYYFDNVSSFSGQIQGAQISFFARKNDEGSRAFRDVANGGSFTGPNDIYLGDSYSYHHIPYDTNPAGGGAFTPANINSTDFGMKLTA